MSFPRRERGPIPGDLPPAEIDRIMRDALLVIRRQGREALEGMTFVPERARAEQQDIGAASNSVLDALARKPQTVYDLAASLKLTFAQVHGVMSWLRKCQRIQVHHWTTSPKGRRVAVYQVKQA